MNDGTLATTKTGGSDGGISSDGKRHVDESPDGCNQPSLERSHTSHSNTGHVGRRCGGHQGPSHGAMDEPLCIQSVQCHFTVPAEPLQSRIANGSVPAILTTGHDARYGFEFLARSGSPQSQSRRRRIACSTTPISARHQDAAAATAATRHIERSGAATVAATTSTSGSDLSRIRRPWFLAKRQLVLFHPK